MYSAVFSEGFVTTHDEKVQLKSAGESAPQMSEEVNGGSCVWNALKIFIIPANFSVKPLNPGH